MTPEQARQRAQDRAREIGREIRKHLFISDNQGIRPPSAGLSWEADDIITVLILAVRGEALEAARVIDQGQETHSNIAEGVFLTPRKKDNRAGLGYAAAIRALARSAEPNPPATP